MTLTILDMYQEFGRFKETKSNPIQFNSERLSGDQFKYEQWGTEFDDQKINEKQQMTGQRTITEKVCLLFENCLVKSEPIPPLSSVIGQIAQVDLALRHPPDT